MASIRESVVKTADLVAEIATVGKEQAQAVALLAESLGQIDQVTHQTSASIA